MATPVQAYGVQGNTSISALKIYILIPAPQTPNTLTKFFHLSTSVMSEQSGDNMVIRGGWER